jgi:hypothetical protein
MTCLEYHVHSHRFPAEAEYWLTPAGLTTRVKSLGQVFTYGVYNNAVKVLGSTGGATYMEWVTMGDDRVCPLCRENSQKGNNGRFNPEWFTPMMPVHPGCRCQWMIVWT